MRARLWILAAGFVLVGAMASAPAMADVDWSGAGYYLEDDANALLGGFISGPYSSEADCKTALSALSQDDQQYAACTYYASDPDKSGSSN